MKNNKNLTSLANGTGITLAWDPIHSSVNGGISLSVKSIIRRHIISLVWDSLFYPILNLVWEVKDEK